MKLFVVLLSASLLLRSSLWAEDSPTPTLQSRVRQLRRPLSKLQKDIKKHTAPNPKISHPRPDAMPPANTPVPQKPGTEKPTASGAERFFAGVARYMTTSWDGNIFVWLPAISTDPNTGPTYGLMPVLVLADKSSKRIRHLLAPSYTYNELFGQTFTGRYYFYPSESSQFYSVISYSARTNRELKVRYENPAMWEGQGYLRVEAYSRINGSQRFFGIGPSTDEGNEAGYTAKSSVARASAGINFLHAWRAIIGTRYRREKLEGTIVPGIATLADRYPGRPELDATETIAHEFRLLFDTRDYPVTPSRGSSGEFVVEKTNRKWGSDSSFFRYGLEGTRFFTWRNPKYVTVAHTLAEKVNGSYAPFYELAQVGGRDSLRGYGDGRFTDRGRMVLNVEHRITMASVSLMDIQTNFEIAPFVDVGTVFPNLQGIRSKYVNVVPGVGFRAAVKPNVVGDVEIGIGRDGPAVYVDINYPF